MSNILHFLCFDRKWSKESSHSPAILNTMTLVKSSSDGTRTTNSRRISVLNKVFMRYITDLMATGENSSEFLGRGIEINKVYVIVDNFVYKILTYNNL